MHAKKELLEEDNNVASWIFTFADLMTLLLVFFVLLFSLSSIEVERFEQAMRSLNQAFSGESGANSIIELPHEAPVKPDIPEVIEEVLPVTDLADKDADKNADNVAEEEKAVIESQWQQLAETVTQEMPDMVSAEIVEISQPRDGKMNIKVQGDMLFPSGSAEFNPKMMSVLDSIVLTLKKNPDLKLSIQGHTDDVPIETTRFPSNWDLSAIRATNVLRYMVRGGLEVDRVSATGYGESVPLVPNDSMANRARNRRLEFVLERRNVE